MAQPKTLQNFHSPADRLRALRNVLQVKWSQISELLQISESMIYGVLNGSRSLSDKALHRVAELERMHRINVERSVVQDEAGALDVSATYRMTLGATLSPRMVLALIVPLLDKDDEVSRAVVKDAVLAVIDRLSFYEHETARTAEDPPPSPSTKPKYPPS